MISNQIYLIIIIISSMLLIAELPSIVAGYWLSDIILALYVGYLIRTFFMHAISTEKS